MKWLETKPIVIKINTPKMAIGVFNLVDMDVLKVSDLVLMLAQSMRSKFAVKGIARQAGEGDFKYIVERCSRHHLSLSFRGITND